MGKKLKIGFDLDGVILYNPIRIFRPFASYLKFLKPYLFHEKAESFYFPNSNLEKYIWRQLHKTSYRVAGGFNDLSKLIKKGSFEAYLITSRYDFLKSDFEYWVNKLNRGKTFKKCFYNKNNLQPNEFKKRMIRKLDLDYFVEDNWGVIRKLNGDLKKVKILWISNLFDRMISYRYKFFNLKEVADFLSRLF